MISLDPAPVAPRGGPVIGDGGRTAYELGAGLPPRAPGVPDHVLSEYETPGLQIRAASIRGLLHRYRGEPRQDAFSVVHDPAGDLTVVVVCDGVGSLPRSQEAAALVAERLPGHFLATLDWVRALRQVNDELADFARAPDLPGRAAEMATTVVAVAVGPSPDRPSPDGDGPGRTAWVAWTDDSTAWHLRDGEWSLVTGPAPGDDDPALAGGPIRALPSDRPRILTATVPFDGGAFFVMTDGVGNPLADAPEVAITLSGWWSRPPTVFEFGRQVGFARRSHLDDRTVVGLWARDRVADAP